MYFYPHLRMISNTGLGASGILWATLATPQVRWLLWFPLVLACLQLPFIPLPRYVFPVMPDALVFGDSGLGVPVDGVDVPARCA